MALPEPVRPTYEPADVPPSPAPSPSFAHCSFAQIAQEKWVTVSDSLSLLRTNKRPWANCSGRSWQNSNHERCTQAAHDKRANKRIAHFFGANRSFALSLTKTSELPKKNFFIKSYFFTSFKVFWKFFEISLIPSFLKSDVSESLRSLTKNERCERIAHQNEQMKESLVFFERIAHSLILCKTMSDSLRKQMTDFPTLIPSTYFHLSFLVLKVLNSDFRIIGVDIFFNCETIIFRFQSMYSVSFTCSCFF